MTLCTSLVGLAADAVPVPAKRGPTKSTQRHRSEMNEILEKRRIQCAAILEALLAAPEFPFDDKLKPSLPEKDGLYVIARKDVSGRYEYLHAGRSTGKRTTGLPGLRGRIWDDH